MSCNCLNKNKHYYLNMGCCVPTLVDPNLYYDKEEIDELLSNIEVSGVTEDILEEKLEDFYTKDETNGLLDDLEQELQDKIDEIVIEQGGVSEHWVEEYVEGELQDYYTKGEVDEKLKQGGGGSGDSYTKSEADARFGTKQEQEQLRNDVEEALGEAAKAEADLQKKVDKTEFNSFKDSQYSYWQGTKTEYDRISSKDNKTIYLIYEE